MAWGVRRPGGGEAGRVRGEGVPARLRETHIMAFRKKVYLLSLVVTGGGASMGLRWLG